MSEWTTFVQWKGTSLCMDFICPDCSKQSHFDGFFAYHIECPYCLSVFKMPTDLAIEKVSERPVSRVLTAERDDDESAGMIRIALFLLPYAPKRLRPWIFGLAIGRKPERTEW